MKFFFVLGIAVSTAAVIACNTADSRYVDLETGKTVTLEKNADGLLVDAETKEPVYIYVDTRTNDTIYGKTGKVINGRVERDDNDKWVFVGDVDNDNRVRYSDGDGDYKKKVEKDGDIKIKDGDTKIKIDAEEGTKKVKRDD